jgi:metal-responsive CopG/Arc/MetJ family transcriptional regulator
MFFIFSNETLGQEFYRVSVVKSSSDFSTIRCYIPREKVRANIVFEEDITSQNLKIASKIKNNNGAESIENNFLDKIIVLNGNWVNENCLEIMVVNNSQEHIKTLLYDIFDIEMLKVKID